MNKKEMLTYDTDASRLIGKTEKVFFPKRAEEIQNIIKTYNLDIVPRGGGTNQLGGTLPNNSIVIDISKMNKIISFDPQKRIIEVEAGISIKELNEKLNYINFEFPIEPINEASTIGGMAAVNSFNPRSMRYERIKDWIEEIEFVNGRGELMKTSKADLGDICGMEGITGIIVRIKMKVIKKIERSAAIFQTEILDEALSMARRLKLENDVIMLELFSPETSEILNLPKKYNLIIEFDSQRGKIKGEEYKKIMDLNKNAYFILINQGYYNNEDTKFFFDKLNDFILYLESNKIPYISYLGDGIVYSFFRDYEKEKRKQVIELIRKMGGKFVNGIGIKRRDLVDSFEKKIINRVKLRHDPFGRLNKNKIIDFEARVPAGRHLKPLQGHEIEEMRPFLGEKMSASEINEEEKTPEEKMEEFIEKVEILEEMKAIPEKKEEINKPEERPPIKEDPYSTKQLIKEYAYTYGSESSKDKMMEVEKLARDVSKTIVHEGEKKRSLTKEEEALIKRVMLGESSAKNEEKMEDKNNNH
ncbi:MAG: FAD-binding oxidoreductase [Candidatus Nanoarchaeia archaeon]|nr:FAD-binding oxidoreductase [Candidatus Nanoarchaeia archaeon]MDD5740771.1 FAD-binding oxidoreductase [Candidatus Nanoarchaeia archaeon]